MKVVINRCFGGFGLSDAAYEKLIEWGVPVRRYINQRKDPKTRLYLPEPSNDGEVIFDRTLDDGDAAQSVFAYGRYWDTWTREKRAHPLLVRVVEELGRKANGMFAELGVVDIPFDSNEGWEIDEYDGIETIEECHRSWC